MPTFIDTYIRRPPVVLPLLALFHIFLLVQAATTFYPELADKYNGPQMLWLVLASVFSFFCIAFKRWAATAYIGLGISGLIIRYYAGAGTPWFEAGTCLFPVDLVEIFFLLFYYKRME